MAETIRELQVQFTAETRGVTVGFGKVKGGLKDVGARLRKNVDNFKAWARQSAIAVAGVTASVGLLSRHLINASAKAEETANKFRVVFAEEAAAVGKWVDDINSKFGLGRTNLRRWLSSVQDILVPMGFARDEASRLSTEIVQLGLDLASFNSGTHTTDEALQALISSLIGEREPLRRLGVTITEAEIKEQALKRGIIATGEEMTRQQKAILTYKLAMEQSADAVGDLERTQDSYMNRLKKFHGTWQDFQEEIGEVIKQTYGKDTLNMAINFLEQNKEAVSDWAKWTIRGYREVEKDSRRLLAVLTLEWDAFWVDFDYAAKEGKGMWSAFLVALTSTETFTFWKGEWDAFGDWLHDKLADWGEDIDKFYDEAKEAAKDWWTTASDYWTDVMTKIGAGKLAAMLSVPGGATGGAPGWPGSSPVGMGKAIQNVLGQLRGEHTMQQNYPGIESPRFMGGTTPAREAAKSLITKFGLDIKVTAEMSNAELAALIEKKIMDAIRSGKIRRALERGDAETMGGGGELAPQPF